MPDPNLNINLIEFDEDFFSYSCFNMAKEALNKRDINEAKIMMKKLMEEIIG